MTLPHLATLDPETPLSRAIHPLDVYALAIEVERETGRYPTDAEILRWQTVGDVLAGIERIAP